MNRAAFSFAAVAVLITIAVPASGKPGSPPGKGRTFEANGVTIWYEVLGEADGTPLVVVNGGPGFDHSYLRISDVWDRLAKRRPVVMYDQRGNGRSSDLEEGQSCTLVDQIDDLDALRQELGRERIDLLGHSWGGYLVMAYATRHPEHVSHLIIADSAAPKWTGTEFIFTYIYPEAIERQSQFDALDEVGDPMAHVASLREYLGMLCVSPEKRDELLARSKEFDYSRKINQLLNADLAEKDLWPALSGFTMPTLVVTGRFDINVAPSTAWKIHKAIPNSRFVVFEKSGHLPFFEEPEAWVEVIDHFLDERDSLASELRAEGVSQTVKADVP